MTTPEVQEPAFSPISTGADLLAAIPVSLGYFPADSVLVVLCQGHRIELTIRIDIDWFQTAFECVAAQVETAVTAVPDAVCYLLGYFSDRGLVEASLAELEDVVPCEVADILITDDRKWWSLACSAECCPREGRPFDRATHLVTAEAVFAGFDVGLDRDDLVAAIAGPTDVGAAQAEFGKQRRSLGALSHQVRLGRLQTLLANADCRRPVILAALVADDRCAGWLLDSLDPANAAQRVRALLAAVAVCPPNQAANLIALLGVSAWLSGGGPILTAATARLNELEPRHPMGSLLADLIRQVVPPYTWQSYLGVEERV